MLRAKSTILFSDNFNINCSIFCVNRWLKSIVKHCVNTA